MKKITAVLFLAMGLIPVTGFAANCGPDYPGNFPCSGTAQAPKPVHVVLIENDVITDSSQSPEQVDKIAKKIVADPDAKLFQHTVYMLQEDQDYQLAIQKLKGSLNDCMDVPEYQGRGLATMDQSAKPIVQLTHAFKAGNSVAANDKKTYQLLIDFPVMAGYPNPYASGGHVFTHDQINNGSVKSMMLEYVTGWTAQNKKACEDLASHKKATDEVKKEIGDLIAPQSLFGEANPSGSGS